MIKAQHIQYVVGNRTLLEDVSVHFHPGQISLIIGPNGAGKSTLLKILCNQLRPQQGSIRFGDKSLWDYGHIEMARIRAVLSQQLELAFPLRVEEVVMMGRYPHFTGQPDAKDFTACREAMEQFDLIPLAQRNYVTLSGGEKQRVHFARVMAQTWYPVPGYDRYLLLDEPLTYLDIQHQYQFMETVQQLARQDNRVVVGVVHDLNLAARFADQLIILHEGSILAQGSPHTVLTPGHVLTAFGMKPNIQEYNGKLQLIF
jgi:iron complex transport system ATP-binding protein